MHKVLTTLITLALTTQVIAQNVFGEIEFKNSISELRMYSISDSLIQILIKEDNLSDITHEFNISNQGIISKSHDVTKIDDLPLTIVAYKNSLYSYTITSEDGKKVLSILNKNSKEKVSKEIKSKILGACRFKDRVILVSFDKSTNSLKVSQIEGSVIVAENSYPLSIDINRLGLKKVQIIEEKSYVHLSECIAPIKLKVVDNNLIITVDESYEVWYEDSNYLAKTVIYSINLESKAIETKVVLESSKYKFISYHFNNQLYRVINRPEKFELKIFDEFGSIKKSFTIVKDEVAKRQFITQRTGGTNFVSRDENLFDLIKTTNSCKPFVYVEKDLNGVPVLSWGNYYDRKGAIAPVFGPTAAIQLAVAAIGTAVVQSMDGPGISSYFYLTESENGYSYSNEHKGIIRNLIDTYELDQASKKIKFDLKGYCKFGDEAIGIYKEKKSKSFQLVKFRN